MGVMAVWLLLILAVPANATTLTFGLDYEFSGATAPEGTEPWITATFNDATGNENTVNLTMNALNLVGTEFIDAWYFNFDPNLDPTYLTFSSTNVSTGANDFKADGDGYFDILFDFPESGNRFTGGESVVYAITYPIPINVYSFNFYSSPGGGNGSYLSAAHIQGIGSAGTESGWVGASVPDASIMFLLGPSLIALGLFGRKKSKK